MEVGKVAEELKLKAQIWKHVYGFVDSLLLRSAIELGIFDAIHQAGEPMTLSKLSKALPSSAASSIDTSKLKRLLNYLLYMDLLKLQGDEEEEEEEEGFSLTGLSEFLLQKSLTKWALAIIVESDMVCWHQLSSCCNLEAGKDGKTAFERVYGAGPWEMAGKDEETNKIINEAMACDTRIVMPAFIERCRGLVEGVASMVDVGGGTGTAMRMMVEAFPEMKCTVFDLPHVVETARDCGGIDLVGGDMFKTIPSAEAVFLKFMLHNFDDKDCVKILENCKRAIPLEGGKVIILDIVIDDAEMDDDDDVIRAKLSLDIDMMVNTGGKERSRGEWKELLHKAGFPRHEIIHIPTIQSGIFAYPS